MSKGLPGVHIVTLHNPGRYTEAQLDLVATIAWELGRGKFMLLEAPLLHPLEEGDK